MDHKTVQFMEHMAIKSPLSLNAFCDVARRALGLPEFEYDAENETEWCISIKEGVMYNISRPYKAETLCSWDPTVPEGCNFGLILIFPKAFTAPSEASAALVEHVGRTLASAFGTAVYYHRTWLGVDNNLPRNTTFLPVQSDPEGRVQ